MFPAVSGLALRNLRPGDVVRARSTPLVEDAGRAGVGAGMGMSLRPFVAPVAESLPVRRRIVEAGYPVMGGARNQVGSG